MPPWSASLASPRRGSPRLIRSSGSRASITRRTRPSTARTHLLRLADNRTWNQIAVISRLDPEHTPPGRLVAAPPSHERRAYESQGSRSRPRLAVAGATIVVGIWRDISARRCAPAIAAGRGTAGEGQCEGSGQE